MPDTEVRWTGERPQGGHAEGFVVVNFRITEEGQSYVGECIEFGVSSFGGTVEEAMANTMEAVEAYLEALEDEQERDRVFTERGIEFYRVEPPEEMEIRVLAHPGEYVSPQRLAVGV